MQWMVKIRKQNQSGTLWFIQFDEEFQCTAKKKQNKIGYCVPRMDLTYWQEEQLRNTLAHSIRSKNPKYGEEEQKRNTLHTLSIEWMWNIGKQKESSTHLPIQLEKAFRRIEYSNKR